MGSYFGVGAPPIFEPILVGIESDVHWGYDLAFEKPMDRSETRDPQVKVFYPRVKLAEYANSNCRLFLLAMGGLQTRRLGSFRSSMWTC